MSIATLARKSRAQRGASTRAGWTLATTKSGNCPGPCGGGAPAKQQSFRRLMKNKARPGVKMPSVRVDSPIDTLTDCACCPPVATWKKTNDPKGEQSIGYYLWRKKQLTHNCIPHCIPHREHYNPNYIYITWTGPTIERALHDAKWELYPTPGWTAADSVWAVAGLALGPGGVPPVPHIYKGAPSGWWADGGVGSPLNSNEIGVGTHPPTTGWYSPAGTPFNPGDLQIVDRGQDEKVCVYEAPCDNVGCKCNCNKSMGGTACCVVHKTMLPLSNSENIPWVIEDRTCLQIEKPNPRNPNTC